MSPGQFDCESTMQRNKRQKQPQTSTRSEEQENVDSVRKVRENIIIQVNFFGKNMEANMNKMGLGVGFRKRSICSEQVLMGRSKTQLEKRVIAGLTYQTE